MWGKNTKMSDWIILLTSDFSLGFGRTPAAMTETQSKLRRQEKDFIWLIKLWSVCVCVCVFSYSWTQVLIPLGNHSISWLYVPLCRFHSQAACSLWWPLVSPDLYPNGLAVLTFLRDLAKTPGLNLISLTWVIYSLLSQSVYLKQPGSLDSLSWKPGQLYHTKSQSRTEVISQRKI